MKDKDVKIGMKVVPHDKTSHIFMGLRMSYNWESAQEVKQPFLYVADFDGGYWILNINKDTPNGDYFNACDFEPYEEKPRQVTSDFVPRPSVIVKETYNGAFILEQIGTGKSYCYGTLSKVHEKLSELFTA